jgi:hypothetical protein
VQAARTQCVSGHPACDALSCPRAAAPPLLALGAAWSTLLPIVYSEGVIHKNSRTTILFPPFPLLLVLVPPSALSNIKATELKALSKERAQEAGAQPRR